MFSLPPLLPLQPSRFVTTTSWDSARGCRDGEASRLPGARRRRRWRRVAFARTSGVLHRGARREGGCRVVPSVRSGAWSGNAARNANTILLWLWVFERGPSSKCACALENGAHMPSRDHFAPHLAGKETHLHFLSLTSDNLPEQHNTNVQVLTCSTDRYHAGAARSFMCKHRLSRPPSLPCVSATAGSHNYPPERFTTEIFAFPVAAALGKVATVEVCCRRLPELLEAHTHTHTHFHDESL